MIRLIYAGKSLADEQNIEFYNMKAGDTIHMLLQLKGGSFWRNQVSSIGRQREWESKLKYISLVIQPRQNSPLSMRSIYKSISLSNLENIV